MINWIKGLLVGALLLPFSFENGADIRYFQPSTIPLIDSTDLIQSTIIDSLLSLEINQVTKSDGTPLHYFIELKEGVCFENECRPLDILLYWNITGRYLGFELLDGEYLSKYDHFYLWVTILLRIWSKGRIQSVNPWMVFLAPQ